MGVVSQEFSLCIRTRLQFLFVVFACLYSQFEKVYQFYPPHSICFLGEWHVREQQEIRAHLYNHSSNTHEKLCSPEKSVYFSLPLSLSVPRSFSASLINFYLCLHVRHRTKIIYFRVHCLFYACVCGWYVRPFYRPNQQETIKVKYVQSHLTCFLIGAICKYLVLLFCFN